MHHARKANSFFVSQHRSKGETTRSSPRITATLSAHLTHHTTSLSPCKAQYRIRRCCVCLATGRRPQNENLNHRHLTDGLQQSKALWGVPLGELSSSAPIVSRRSKCFYVKQNNTPKRYPTINHLKKICRVKILGQMGGKKKSYCLKMTTIKEIITYPS